MKLQHLNLMPRIFNSLRVPQEVNRTKFISSTDEWSKTNQEIIAHLSDKIDETKCKQLSTLPQEVVDTAPSKLTELLQFKDFITRQKDDIKALQDDFNSVAYEVRSQKSIIKDGYEYNLDSNQKCFVQMSRKPINIDSSAPNNSSTNSKIVEKETCTFAPHYGFITITKHYSDGTVDEARITHSTPPYGINYEQMKLELGKTSQGNCQYIAICEDEVGSKRGFFSINIYPSPKSKFGTQIDEGKEYYLKAHKNGTMIKGLVSDGLLKNDGNEIFEFSNYQLSRYHSKDGSVYQ